MTDLAPGDVIAGYRLEEVIGAGGMSVVFRATQVSLGRSVAFKVLRKDLGTDPEFAERFRTEARALAELSHPNIVAVYDQGEHDGSYYLVMEYIDGVSLRDVMEDHRLSPADALKIVPDLCGALEYAHSKNIIHRDIKPENILVDRAGVPRIADFGLVRIVGDTEPATRLTKTQAILGTLDYMAPEQREGVRDIDHRADIYSLGVVLYEMLTGELPIARFPRPSERVDVGSGIDEIVLKVLEKDRDRRYQRASFVAQDLTRAQHGPLTPHPDHDAAPSTVAGRLISMGTSFSFFFFTVVYVVIMIASGHDEDSICLATGIAIPFYLGQLVLNGLLPRPVVRPKNFFVRHPVLAFGSLAVVTAIAAENGLEEEPALLLLGLLISCGILIWAWRRKIFRGSSNEPAFVPWAGPPQGYEDLRSGRLPRATREAVHRYAGRARRWVEENGQGHRQRRAQRHADRRGPEAPVRAIPVNDSGGSLSPAPTDTGIGDDGALGGASEAAGTPPKREKPLSVSTLFAFIVMLPTILLTIAMIILVFGFDGVLAPLQLPMSYREAHHMFEGLWSAPINSLEKIVTLVSLVPLALLVPPFVLLFIAVPGIIGKRRRGVGLFAATAILFVLEFVGLAGVSTRIGHEGHSYASTASRHLPSGHTQRQDDLLKSLQHAAGSDSIGYRAALLHRANLLAESTEAPLAARTPLIEIATDVSTTTNLRIAALLLLERLFGDRLFMDPMADPNAPPNWTHTFLRNVEHRSTPYALRQAFEHTVQTCAPPNGTAEAEANY
ncbi:MAG: serine/threonine protein kinase [Planctomycetes bacterium]|nr:serine/threonine protein kinase [Planctomycetota bacterium]